MKALSDERRQEIRANALAQKEILKQYGKISGAETHYLIKFTLELTDQSNAELLAEKDKAIEGWKLESQNNVDKWVRDRNKYVDLLTAKEAELKEWKEVAGKLFESLDYLYRVFSGPKDDKDFEPTIEALTAFRNLKQK